MSAPKADARLQISTLALQLFALSGFAFLQPLLDLLAREPGFLVAHDASAPEILALVAGLALVPALLMTLPCVLLGFVSQVSARLLCSAWIALLAASIALPVLVRDAGVGGPWDIVAAVALGCAVAYLHGRSAGFRSFVSVLGIAPILFAAYFISSDSVEPLLFASRAPLDDAHAVDSDVPLVFVVFDELGLHSLLDEDGEVDAIRYPAFARLASGSHWFRAASAVDWRTMQVLPALLTGRYPGPNRSLPVAANHPENLFSLLAPSYRLNVVETRTSLHESSGRAASRCSRTRLLVSDLGFIYLHLLLPERHAAGLPDVANDWKGFASGPGSGAERGAAGADGISDDGTTAVVAADRAAQFREFIRSIDAKPRASFHFIHITLPHRAWEYMPAGERYPHGGAGGAAFDVWLPESWWTLQAQQRHLLQLEFVDSLLGELLDHLETIGLYDDALVVVTADHGIGFWPSEGRRNFARTEHPQDILNVPLFVKEPGQTLGGRRLDNVESVDVMPMILDRMGIETDWRLDGCSPFAEGCRDRATKIAFTPMKYSGVENRKVEFLAEIVLDDSGLKRKLELFGSGRRKKGLFRFGEHAALVGRGVSDFASSKPLKGGVRLDPKYAGERVPIRVVGTLELEAAELADESHFVAISVAGRIEAVVPAVTDGRNELRRLAGLAPEAARIVSALLPVDATGGPLEELEVHWVSGRGDAVTLFPLEVR